MRFYFGLLLQRFQYIVFCFVASGLVVRQNILVAERDVVAGTRDQKNEYAVLAGFFPFSFQITLSFVFLWRHLGHVSNILI